MRERTDQTQNAGHRECWELLPWWVNDTLTDAQKQQVETHLSHCEICRSEADGQMSLRGHLRREESVLYAPQAALQKLMNRIDAAPAQESKRWANDMRVSRTAKTLAATVMAGVLGVVVAGSVVSWKVREERSAARYTTLASKSAADPSHPAVRVVFAPGMSVAQLSSLLRSHGAQVVTGPSEAGVYTLGLSTQANAGTASRVVEPGGPAVEAAVAVAQELRKDPNVLFAEPVMTAGGTGQ